MLVNLADRQRQQHQKAKDFQFIWKSYSAHKTRDLAPLSLKDFRKVDRLLSDYNPLIGRRQLRDLLDFAREQYGQDFYRRIFIELRAACDWAANHELIKESPFVGMKLKRRSESSSVPDFFSRQEWNRIIGFLNSPACPPHWEYYLDFIALAPIIGARPGELIALHREDILEKEKLILIRRSFNSEGGSPRPPKNGPRRFPISRQLLDMLADAGILRKKSGLIFPSPGTHHWDEPAHISLGNFSRRVWSPLLQRSGIRHRGFYHTRHTFITWALQKGASPQQIARWVGSSPTIIHKHYAGIYSVPPEL